MRRILLVLMLALRSTTTLHAQSAPLAGLDAYITKAMADWQVPGLTIAVVRNDSVIYERGFGVRELGKPGLVDQNTMFPIASTTKAFTVGALGTLVDEGRLKWDDKVSAYLPTLQLSDAYVTQQLTVRDLLTHRIGLARSDNLWLVAPFTRAEVLRHARYLAPPAGFRVEYGYNNLAYILAGEVAGAASGSNWDDLIAQRWFQPLGMTRSTTHFALANADANVAQSHIRVDGKAVAVPRRNYDNIGGAGAIFSSGHDMAQWVRMHLNGGTYNGKRLLQPATLKEMYTPQTAMRSDSVADRMFPSTNFRAYGFGWFLQDYNGRKMVHHSGSINWTRTHVGMIPSEHIGVVVIANLNTSNLQQAVMYRVLDALMGLPARDWSAEYLAVARRGDERSDTQARALDSSRVKNTKPSLALEQYAGPYVSDVYGEVKVFVENGHLVLRYSDDYTADLEHWNYDTFSARWRRTGFGRAFAVFTLDSRARVATLELDELGVLRRVRP
ncbi:MAG: serine hydrolase [Gemmatimonadetes bacterium]|nr:serine hydrolase [Gemmatimonadota bacterium]